MRQNPQRVSRDEAEVGYGRDQKNRVVAAYEFDVADPRKVSAMSFLRYSGDRIIGSHFIPGAVCSGNKVVGNDWTAGGVLADVFEATLAGGRIVRLECLMSSSWEWKTIEWEGDKVASVLEGMRGRKAHRQITYSKTGKVVEELDLTKPPKRKPLPKGVTMQSLAKQIRERLGRAVVTTVTKAKIKEPVYCLALNYDCEGNP